MSRHRGKRSASVLGERLDALNEARGLAEGVLPPEVLEGAYRVLDRASSRRSLSAAHTVVGFFGATGSGKSSLFNAVLGAPVATAAARRPTTSEPLAAVWGTEGSDALLDWLGVGRRHAAAPVEGFADDATGLILLDLPDFDSTALEHRDVVERMVGMVDVMVWVLDPQKYADDALHTGYLRRFGGHGAVTLAVLNQTDRLAAAELPPVVESLSSLLASEGLARVPLIAASAATGAGVGEVRAAIARVAASRRAATERLEADVASTAAELAEASGTGRPAGVRGDASKRLAAELAEAANVPLVVDAVRASYRREAGRRTGWPVTRWLGRFGCDPLQRLGLRPVEDAPHVHRTSLPAETAAGRARTDAAVRAFADAASEGAPGPWRAAIRAAARDGREGLPDALDQAVASTDLGARRRSWWWGLANVLQWLALVTALGGAAWLGVLALLGYLQLPVPAAPRVEDWPVPTLMIAGGGLLGIVLGLALAPVAALGARRRAARARRRLAEAVRAVAEREVAAPVVEQVARCEAFSAALARARG
ncbi:GTPase [Sinomonas halotolerans]|uniref:GTPase n=1 Tax=Sinomonas halotolerans TaxID=1644133 RepID=A0ABU9WXB4_9MICC